MYWSAGSSHSSMDLSVESLPRFAAARRAAYRSGFLGGALLGFVLVEHRAGGGRALFAEFVAVVGAPVVGVDARAVVAAEMRHHVARIEFVGALGLLPVRPVVRLVQKDAKLALLSLQPLDQRDCIIGGADDAVIVLDKPFERVLARRHDKAALVVVEVTQV